MPGGTYRRWNGSAFVSGGTVRRCIKASPSPEFMPPAVGATDPDAAAFLAVNGTTDSDQIHLLDTYVIGLKSNNVWPALQANYPFLGEDEDAHKWNLCNPANTNAAWRITWHGAGQHAATGYHPGGNAANFGDTHYVPLDDAIIDDCHLSIYSRTNSVGGSQCDMGSYNPGNSNRFHLIIRYDGDQFYPGLAEVGSIPSPTPSTDSRGLFASSRSDMTTEYPYRNGLPFGSPLAVAAVSLPTQSLYIGRLNDFPPGPGNREYCGVTIGRSLTDQQNADLYGLTQAFNAGLGREV